jgi:hypothetical protein
MIFDMKNNFIIIDRLFNPTLESASCPKSGATDALPVPGSIYTGQQLPGIALD